VSFALSCVIVALDDGLGAVARAAAGVLVVADGCAPAVVALARAVEGMPAVASCVSAVVFARAIGGVCVVVDWGASAVPVLARTVGGVGVAAWCASAVAALARTVGGAGIVADWRASAMALTASYALAVTSETDVTDMAIILAAFTTLATSAVGLVSLSGGAA
jgi:hypothetical protein